MLVSVMAQFISFELVIRWTCTTRLIFNVRHTLFYSDVNLLKPLRCLCSFRWSTRVHSASKGQKRRRFGISILKWRKMVRTSFIQGADIREYFVILAEMTFVVITGVAMLCMTSANLRSISVKFRRILSFTSLRSSIRYSQVHRGWPTIIGSILHPSLFYLRNEKGQAASPYLCHIYIYIRKERVCRAKTKKNNS